MLTKDKPRAPPVEVLHGANVLRVDAKPGMTVGALRRDLRAALGILPAEKALTAVPDSPTRRPVEDDAEVQPGTTIEFLRRGAELG